MKDSTKKIAFGTLVAAAAGYVTGILTAPKSGKETRAEIKMATKNGMAEAEKQLKNIHTELNSLIETAKKKSGTLNGKAKTELNNLTDKASIAKEKVRDVLSALHEGSAEDKDLQKALDDASKSLGHLKKYLKK
jgi:gas vesicle protein